MTAPAVSIDLCRDSAYRINTPVIELIASWIAQAPDSPSLRGIKTFINYIN
jgi:hypothetical protein